LIVEFSDPKSGSANNGNVQSTIRIAKNINDSNRSSDKIWLCKIFSDFLPRTNEDDPKRETIVNAMVDHRAVALLKDMQLRPRMWKKHHIQRKQRQ
jgi:hypothetical protein